MNTDTLAGTGNDLKGQFKEALGDATRDPGLQQDGVADQLTGQVQKGIGGLKDFMRERPFAAAAVAGVVGLALLNTLRGK